MKAKSRLKEKYESQVLSQISKDLGVENRFAVPKVVKVVVNMGVGGALKSKELLEQYKKDLMAITGQMPSVRNARVSVASFGIRRGMPVGLKVTLRGERMYSFLDKLFSIVLPRLRDFRGLSLRGFDRYGNYTIGLSEHTVFPEIDVTKSQAHGLEITLVTNAGKKDKAVKLLSYLGMPFEKDST